jgi:hypothetical protein
MTFNPASLASASDAPTFASALADVKFCLENDLTPMIEGAPGGGKTDLVIQACGEVGRPVVVDTLATCESVDLRGLPGKSADGSSVTWSRPEFLTRLWDAGPNPVLFWDEANAVSQSLQVPLMQMTLAKRVGPHSLPPGTTVVLAGNRVADRAAAQRMGTALNSRVLFVPFEADIPGWLAWAARNDIAPELRAFIMLRGAGTMGRPGLFNTFDPTKPEARAFACPRSYAQSSPIVAKAPEGQRLRLLRGKLGDAAATELDGFCRVFRTLPPIPAILADPMSVAVPSEISSHYALATALSKAANPTNFANVARYMGRIGPEFLTVTMTDAVRRNHDLAHTKAYIDWASVNSDLAI